MRHIVPATSRASCQYFFVFNKSILFISHNRRFVMVWINVLQTFWLSELRKRAHLLNKFCSSFKCVMFFHFKLFDVFCVLCYLFIFVIFANEQNFVQKKTQTHILQKTAHKITHIVVCLFLLIWTRWKYEKLIINKLHSCSIQLCVALCSVAHLCIWPLNVWCIYCLFTAV